MRKIAAIFCLITMWNQALTQGCPNPGQSPSTAFPVCGTSVFSQTTVPLCDGQILPSPACSADGVRDVNPYYYKFTCFQSGTLGFLITPKDLGDDYDWELYDITGKSPDDIYVNGKLVVSSNWSGESGKTGASSAGTKQFVCAGFGQDLFSKMPNVLVNHNYLLLISHFTQSQSGYNLSFGGGTAVITDSTPPHISQAISSCGGDRLYVKLNKHMRCNSIAGNGSDFYLGSGTATITGVTGFGCADGFDTDSLELTLGSALSPGNYTLFAQNGTDGNTIKDICDNSIPINDNVNFTILARQPTPMDSLEPVKCSPRQLWLHFKKPILCSTVAANGSDFTITGPFSSSITNAYGNCSGSSLLSNEIVINLQQPISKFGNYTITLKKGTDGNTLLDECSEETPEGSAITFEVKEPVDASFTYEIHYGCITDTVVFTNTNGTAINKYNWDLDENQNSSQQNAIGYYQLFNQKKIQLHVTNGLCSDSSNQVINLDNLLKADFTSFDDECPNDPIKFTNNSLGKIINYQWSFGDGSSDTNETPSHSYRAPANTTPFNVQLIITDSLGCQKTAQKTIKIYSSCFLAVPSAFTPNNDGRNDFFHPLNAVKAENLEFKVYNRWGQLVFETKEWKSGWDGNFQGKAQPSGVYIWFLHFRDRDTGKNSDQKGTVMLIR
ncbi:MAG: gliding motility-associated C-terminal domain-containing protein [Flavisolibacter sp.]